MNSNHTFSMIPKAEIQRSTFDRSHTHKTTFNSGYLVPVFVDEALPGDTFNLKMSAFARLATPLKPIMDTLYLDSHFFAVPIRLIWDNWQKFNGEQIDPGDSTDFITPYFNVYNGLETCNPLTLQDYMGIPTNVTISDVDIAHALQYSTLPFRAYNLIWNEWFRDQNLQETCVFPKGDGPDLAINYGNHVDHLTHDLALLKRGKRHDYFTSALPWPQKGPDVTIPLTSTENIYLKGLGIDINDLSSYYASQTVDDMPVKESGGVNATYEHGGPIPFGSFNKPIYLESVEVSEGIFVPNARIELDSAVAASINSLRQAFQIQKLYERDARGGTRYTEIIRSHFGVVSPDARLQRPEYLGGGTTRINVHPVAQNSAAVSGSPQGNLAAFGTAAAQGHGFIKSFTEHCIIIGLVSVRAELTYQEGLNRMWSRKTRFDYYWPSLAHLGEQTVLNKEIFTSANYHTEDNLGNDDVFGYQERYAEYRYKPSMITGLFRSNHPQSLDIWHLAQEFGECPTLSKEFIEENPPVSRVIAVPTEPEFIFDSFFDMKCTRPMPVYSVPGLIDHF